MLHQLLKMKRSDCEFLTKCFRLSGRAVFYRYCFRNMKIEGFRPASVGVILLCVTCSLVGYMFSLRQNNKSYMATAISVRKFSVCWITAPSTEVAQNIAKTLVEGKLAACVNIMPNVTSVYSWKGKIESGTELLMMVKTRSSLVPKVITAVKGVHPYEVPEIIATELTQGLPSYMDWISENTLDE